MNTAAAMPPSAQVHEWLDHLCPWCWIDKRYQAQAYTRPAASAP